MNSIFFVIGPSGVGKTFLTNYALEHLKEYNLIKIPSCVTRPKRKDEIDEKNIYFISDSLFDHYIERDDFIEWEKYKGFKHGILKETFSLLRNKNMIKEITISGIEKIKQYVKDQNYNFNFFTIFVYANENDIINRLYNRENKLENSVNMINLNYDVNISNIKIDKYIDNSFKNSENSKVEFFNFVKKMLIDNMNSR